MLLLTLFWLAGPAADLRVRFAFFGVSALLACLQEEGGACVRACICMGVDCRDYNFRGCGLAGLSCESGFIYRAIWRVGGVSMSRLGCRDGHRDTVLYVLFEDERYFRRRGCGCVQSSPEKDEVMYYIKVLV